jgi:hypothetical protein
LGSPQHLSAFEGERRPLINVATLQLEGLLMAVATINRLLVHKGLLSIDESDLALRSAEASLTSEERLHEELTPARSATLSAFLSGCCR